MGVFSLSLLLYIIWPGLLCPCNSHHSRLTCYPLVQLNIYLSDSGLVAKRYCANSSISEFKLVTSWLQTKFLHQAAEHLGYCNNTSSLSRRQTYYLHLITATPLRCPAAKRKTGHIVTVYFVHLVGGGAGRWLTHPSAIQCDWKELRLGDVICWLIPSKVIGYSSYDREHAVLVIGMNTLKGIMGWVECTLQTIALQGLISVAMWAKFFCAIYCGAQNNLVCFLLLQSMRSCYSFVQLYMFAAYTTHHHNLDNNSNTVSLWIVASLTLQSKLGDLSFICVSLWK